MPASTLVGCWSVHIPAGRNEIGQHLQIGEAARVSRLRRVAADALEMVALKIELARLLQAFFGEARMLAHQRVAERRPIALVLPARIRHHPVEIVEHAGDEQAHVALPRAERLVDVEPVFGDEMGDDGFAVADRFAVVDNVGKLPARRRRGVENVLMRERHAGEPQEGKDLEPVAVVVGDAEQRRVGIEGDHRAFLLRGIRDFSAQRF